MDSSNLVTLNANGGSTAGNNAVLFIYDNNTGISVSMSYLKLTGGTGYKSGSTSYGGAVAILASDDPEVELTMDHCEITGNTADYGGGLNLGAGSFSYGDVTLSDTSVHDNSAILEGGGVF